MHFDGGQASVLIDAEKSAESLAQAVGTWNLKRWQPGFGEWAGDVKKLEESPPSLKVRTYRHTPIIWKIDQNGWKLTLLFNSLCFFFAFFLSKVRHWVHGLLCIWFLATLSLANLIFFQCWRTLTSSLVFIGSERCAATGTAWRHIGQDLRFLRRFCQCRGCPPHLGQGHRLHRHHSLSSVKSVNQPSFCGRTRAVFSRCSYPLWSLQFEN